MNEELDTCSACLMEDDGWGGPGCCEICGGIRAEHTCKEPSPLEQLIARCEAGILPAVEIRKRFE